MIAIIEKTKKDRMFSEKERILNHLLMYIETTRNMGLFHGKIGIIIAFFHYGKNKEKKLQNIAGELLEDIWDSISENLSIDFDSGLSGIGWGIEYLIQNHFVEGNSLEICEEIDLKIMQMDPRRFNDYSVDKGLPGILHYILIHIKGCMEQNNSFPFDSIYFQDLHQSLNSISEKKMNENFKMLISKYNRWYLKKDNIDYDLNVTRFCEMNEYKNPKNLFTIPLGLKKGLAGMLIKNT